MRKEKFTIDQKIILIIISSFVLFLLLIIGFSLPKGIYGIKPLKTITVIVNQEQPKIAETATDKKQSTLYIIFVILLLIGVILYLIFNPSRLLSYIFAFLIIAGIFLLINFILRFNTYKQIQFTDHPTSEVKSFDFLEKINIQPYEEQSTFETLKPKKNPNQLFYIIVVAILILFTVIVLGLFLYQVIKRIIKEIKETGFAFFLFKNKHKKTLVTEVKKAMNEAISLLDNNKNIKNAVINCYIALIYAVKKYAKKVKDPSMTSREFEPVLISLGLESSDIDLITSTFEKAKYSKDNLSSEDKDLVNKSLKNCIIKLKNIDKPVNFQN